MKLFKRMAAAAMAAVLSLSVLTACGGSTSVSAIRLAKLAEEMKKSGTVYIELRNSDYYQDFDQKTAQDENYEIEICKEDGETIVDLITREGHFYTKENDDEWEKERFTETFSKLIPSEEFLAELQVVPNYPIDEVETIYAEVFYAENYDLSNAAWDGANVTKGIAFCFDGNDVKYVVWKMKDGLTIVYDAKMDTEFPEEITAVRESFEEYLQKTT